AHRLRTARIRSGRGQAAMAPRPDRTRHCCLCKPPHMRNPKAIGVGCASVLERFASRTLGRMNDLVSKLARCAIYTRKSTEYNLELAFNSLDAQREACEAYIRSQAHEGWRLTPACYDDGGFSGA